jgi:hypothetical protein
VEETGVHGENHWPVASHWQTLSHNVVSDTLTEISIIVFIINNVDTTLCDKVCQWLATGQWFSPCTPVSSTSKSSHHDITEILLKVSLNTITLILTHNVSTPLDPEMILGYLKYTVHK